MALTEALQDTLAASANARDDAAIVLITAFVTQLLLVRLVAASQQMRSLHVCAKI